jgi:8-oxo-dGTP diphosphatase
MRSADQLIPVAAGVLFDKRGRVLVQRRAKGTHLEGTWEFPGGKADPEESRHGALARELREELGIEVREARPLIRIQHTYSEKTVLLDVWRVESFDGEPRGLEGQPIEWVFPEDLSNLEMPPADRPIVNAVRLPDTCVVTGDGPAADSAFLERLEALLHAGARLIQLRTDRDRAALEPLARAAAAACGRHGAWLVLNGDPEDALDWGAHGVHLTSAGLRRFRERPVPGALWLSVACHDSGELELAARLDADFVLASPVHPTTSHPDATTLGLAGFSDLCREAPMPVYALGGMGPGDCDAVWRAGGQGVAGISGFW